MFFLTVLLLQKEEPRIYTRCGQAVELELKLGMIHAEIKALESAVNIVAATTTAPPLKKVRKTGRKTKGKLCIFAPLQVYHASESVDSFAAGDKPSHKCPNVQKSECARTPLH